MRRGPASECRGGRSGRRAPPCPTGPVRAESGAAPRPVSGAPVAPDGPTRPMGGVRAGGRPAASRGPAPAGACSAKPGKGWWPGHETCEPTGLTAGGHSPGRRHGCTARGTVTRQGRDRPDARAGGKPGERSREAPRVWPGHGSPGRVLDTWFFSITNIYPICGVLIRTCLQISTPVNKHRTFIEYPPSLGYAIARTG